MNSWRRMLGFTLMELLVVLAIMGIGLLMAVPSYQGMVAYNRLDGQARELQSAFNYARSEAIRLNTPVVLCQSLDGTICSSPTGGKWQGWLVRAAGASPGNETGPVLRAFKYMDSTVDVTSASLLAASGHAIRITPQGLVRQFGTDAPLSAYVQFCVEGDSDNISQMQFSSGGQSSLVKLSGSCS